MPRPGPIVFILLLTAGLYVQLFQHELIWDEHTLTTQQFVTDPSWAHYEKSFQQAHRPVTLLSVALDHFIWRGWPPGFAIDSLLYHLAVVTLVYLFCRRRLALFPSLTAALIVALHPIGVETVHYLLGRPDLLSALWMLAALWAWSAYHQSRGSWKALALFYAAGLIALGSKEPALLLPLLVLWNTDFRADDRKPLRTSLIALSPLAVVLGVYLLSTGSPWIGTLAGAVRFNWGLEGLAAMAIVTLQSLRLIMFPIDLCPWYEGLISSTAAPLTTGIYLLGMAGAVVWAWRLRTRAPVAALGIVWLVGILFLIALRAVTVPPPINPLSIRWLYPGLVGVALIIGGLLHLAEARRPLAGRLIASAVVMMLSILTWQAQPVWQNDLTLFQRAVKCNPGSAFITLQYVDVLNKAGRQEQADQLFTQLRARQPNHPRVLSRLVRLAIQRGDYTEAISQSRKLISVAPSPLAYRTMGDLLVLTDQSEAAIDAYRMARTYNPLDMLAIAALGNLYEKGRRWDEAIALYHEGVQMHPKAANLWFRLGRVLEQAGQLQEAARAFEQVMQLDRYCPDGYLAEARVTQKLGEPRSAEEVVKRYTELAHQAAIPRPTADPLDAPCGVEIKISYGRKTRAGSLSSNPAPLAQP